MNYVIADCSEDGRIHLFNGGNDTIEALVHGNGKQVYIMSQEEPHAGNPYVSSFGYSLFERLVSMKCKTTETFAYLTTPNRIQKYHRTYPDNFVKEYFRNLCYTLAVLHRLDDLREESMRYQVFASPLGNKRVGIPVAVVLGIYKAYGGYYDIPKWVQGCTDDSFSDDSGYISDNMIRMFTNKLDGFGIMDSLNHNVLARY